MTKLRTESEINYIKRIRNYSNYYVTSDGRILSSQKHTRNTLGELKELCLCNSRGYKQIYLYKNSSRKCFLVHRLVYQAFKGSIPKNKVINHIDGNPSNNSISNLECITQLKNLRCQNKRRNSNTNHHNVYYVKSHTLDSGESVYRYRVMFCKQHKTLSYGSYKTIEEAIKVRNKVCQSKI